MYNRSQDSTRQTFNERFINTESATESVPNLFIGDAVWSERGSTVHGRPLNDQGEWSILPASHCRKCPSVHPVQDRGGDDIYQQHAV